MISGETDNKSPMEPDNFQQAWRSQSSQTRVTIDPDVLRSAVQQKQQAFRAAILVRDALEIGVAALLLPFWFYAGITHSLPWTWWLCVPAIIFVAGFLVVDRRRHSQKPTDPDQPLAKIVQDSLNQVDHQIWLLRNVFWWYLLPFIIPILAFFAQVTWSAWTPSEGWLSALVLVCLFLFLVVFLIAMYGFVYWLNQSAVRTQLQPRRTELSQLLKSLTDETGEPLDSTQIANLRPTALALAAAGQVRPVEFKVSFWQLAFYGEIGFVGLWFIVILILTVTQWLRDFDSQNWTIDTAEKSPPTVSATEADRYSLVAKKVVDLFNASDYAAVHNLYNPGMSKALPLKKSTEFYTRLAKQYGKIENVELPTGKGYRGWIAFRLRCQRGHLVMSLALDKGNKIAGIYFRPASSPDAGQSFLRRLFSWQHLALFVPFFLVGLLYAWFLQKWTERAVGISNLGVHLQKGQILILWEEIKEIQIFKLLGIRSLWLIKESGEKTILPWTGLERHSDLRASVERCAPANHPIRHHLSLLR
jgi:hypothetical protein